MAEIVVHILRDEWISCPACDAVQRAIIVWAEPEPWPRYVHECVRCGYTILESEWNPATPPPDAGGEGA
jgi:Zn ribbon nucleic-acid-binding protein